MLRSNGAAVSKLVQTCRGTAWVAVPGAYQAELRAFAKTRRATFDAPPARRNRVWQMDYSEFETTAGGTWQFAG
jgi:hypothetical protein